MNKKCKVCGKPFPTSDLTKLPAYLQEEFDKVETCTECLQESLRKGIEEMGL
jgi:hypothetical protein